MPTTPKSILIINRVFPPTFGATGRVACELCLHLRKTGHKITILTTSSAPKIDNAKNLEVIRIASNSTPDSIYEYFKILKSLKREAKKLPAHDIVISMTDPPLTVLIGHDIAKAMKAKHIHWAMDLYPDLLPVMGHNIPKIIYKYVERKTHKAIKNSSAIVPISKCMARYMTHKSLPRHKMYIIENWPERYLQDEEDDQPQSLLDNDKFRILYAGTIGLCHEFLTVLKAAKYFQTHNPEIEFIFTAKGRGKSLLQSQIKQLELNNIRLIQPQSSKRLNNLLATGDLHLITMKPDAVGKIFPSKFYSACAAGRPIIFVGPQECEIHKNIKRYSCGVSVQNNDVQSLVKGILQYFNNSDIWFEHSKNIAGLLDNHHPLQEWEDLIASM